MERVAVRAAARRRESRGEVDDGSSGLGRDREAPAALRPPRILVKVERLRQRRASFEARVEPDRREDCPAAAFDVVQVDEDRADDVLAGFVERRPAPFARDAAVVEVVRIGRVVARPRVRVEVEALARPVPAPTRALEAAATTAANARPARPAYRLSFVGWRRSSGAFTSAASLPRIDGTSASSQTTHADVLASDSVARDAPSPLAIVASCFFTNAAHSSRVKKSSITKTNGRAAANRTPGRSRSICCSGAAR